MYINLHLTGLINSFDKMIRLVATDLDGTLLPSTGVFHGNDMDALKLLGEKEIIRVIATGRSLHSTIEAVGDDFQCDYIVFSSGAGVYDYKKKALVHAINIGADHATQVAQVLLDENVDFTLHRKVPQNHLFNYFRSALPHSNLQPYVDYHGVYATPYEGVEPGHDYCQLMAFVPDMGSFQRIAEKLVEVKKVRVTSPIDHQSIWMEFFNPLVSKANGVKWICDQLNIGYHEVAAMGNDYNDIDLLDAFDLTYVVANAPGELKQNYLLLPSVYDAAFSHLVTAELQLIS
jgi:hypothetical protein